MPTPGGLISAAGPKPGQIAGYTPAQAVATKATSQGYTPTGVVVADDQTVAHNLDQIIRKDSPLMQQAETRARVAMNNRGLLNSSMAVGAAQDSLIAAATPIATADAGTRFTANRDTVAAQNTASQFGAHAANTASLSNAQLGTDVSKANAGAQNTAFGQIADATNNRALADLDAKTRMDVTRLDTDTRLRLGELDAKTRMDVANLDATTRRDIAVLDNDTRLEMTKLDTQTRRELGQLDAQNRQLLQTNASAASMFNDVVKNIAAIAVDPTLTPEAKNAATDSQLALLNEGLRTTAGVSSTVPAEVKGLNLSQYFQAVPTTPAPTNNQVPGSAPAGGPAPAGSGARIVPAGTPGATFVPGGALSGGGYWVK